MGLRAWVKRKAKKAKKDFEKAGRVIEETAKDTGRAFEQGGKVIKKTAEDLAKETEEFFTKEARKVVEQIFNRAKRDIERFAESAVKDTKAAFTKDLPKLAESAFEETRVAFEEKLPELAEKAARDAVAAIMAEAAKGTFTKAVDVAQVLAPDTLGIKIGPVGMTIGNVKDRIDTLQRWANNPPRSKEDIKECIITLAPTSVSVAVDVQFALLVVSSDALEVGFSAEWETASFIEKFDDIIAHF